ncbi:MAG TPA: tetratricopeptide repeat protein [Steroidobacteraceae bacterium]|nr:tetratricopeptide repeat protein [Steroidobacteraceae bacterium]
MPPFRRQFIATLAVLSCATFGAEAPVATAATATGSFGAEGNSIDAYDALARDLLLRIDLIEHDEGNLSRALLAPLFELGKLYGSNDQCQNAIPIIQRAILLSQRLDGVMNAEQLPLYEPLLDCLVERDMLGELQRALDQTLLINERAYGKDDVRMMPALAHAAEWYEEAGLYEEARRLYSRSLKIARKAGGKMSERMVDPLRGLSQTFRLEAQYESERSSALNAAGERALERAAAIVRATPDADPKRRIDTLLELADWYQMSGALRDAAKAYKEVWDIAAATSGTSAAELLGAPEPILYRAQIGTALRRPPPNREKLQHYWVDFQFTVTKRGEVTNVVVTDATAPKDLQLSLAESLKKTHYRPRFAVGQPVDTHGVTLRQGVWVDN